MRLEDGKEYGDGGLLPPVIRNQVLLSDLARLLPLRQARLSTRFQFAQKALDGLPTLTNFASWPGRSRPQDREPPRPRQGLPLRRRLGEKRALPERRLSPLLAPLYGGTSGHAGAILAWRELESKDLAEIPVGVVISAGYAVLWRLYYDKRATVFHTPSKRSRAPPPTPD